MAVKFTTTSQASTHCKICVYGRSGMGKTTLIKTAPKPLIITSEKKLMALKDDNIPTIIIESVDDFQEALDYAIDAKPKKFQTICIDSLTDIAETQLSDLKRQHKDPRQAYGALADIMSEQIRSLKLVEDKHVYAICKAKKIEDEGIQKMMPNMPGQQLLNNLSYYFDFVFLLEEAEDEDGSYRYLQTQPTYKADAKSCGDNLKPIEKPDLTHIITKFLGKKSKKK